MKMIIIALFSLNLFAQETAIVSCDTAIEIKMVGTTVMNESKIELVKASNNEYDLVISTKDEGGQDYEIDEKISTVKLLVSKVVKKELFKLALWGLNEGVYRNLKIDKSKIDQVEIYDELSTFDSQPMNFRLYRYFAKGKEVATVYHNEHKKVCGYKTIMDSAAIGDLSKCEELEDDVEVEKCLDKYLGLTTTFLAL